MKHLALIGFVIIVCVVVFIVYRYNSNTKATIKALLTENGRSWCIKNHVKHPDCDKLLAPLSINDITNTDTTFAVKLMGRFQSGEGIETVNGLKKPFLIYGKNSKDVPLVGIWYDDIQSTVFIVIRGTQNFKDFITDLKYNQQIETIWKKCNPSIHTGFAMLYTTISDKIHDAIKPSVKNVFVVGHSLGASLAYITGYDIADKYNNVNVSVYAIAPPKTGDAEFAKCITTTPNLHVKTIINLADMVPFAIPSFAPNFSKKDNHKPYNFTHIHPIYLFNIESTDILSNHGLPVYLDGVQSQELIKIEKP
jgi:triacylglycerol lipase